MSFCHWFSQLFVPWPKEKLSTNIPDDKTFCYPKSPYPQTQFISFSMYIQRSWDSREKQVKYFYKITIFSIYTKNRKIKLYSTKEIKYSRVYNHICQLQLANSVSFVGLFFVVGILQPNLASKKQNFQFYWKFSVILQCNLN